MPGVTVERLLWIIVTIVIAGVVLFGVIYPYVIGISTVREFTITDVSVYVTSSNGYEVYLTIKNLGTISITKVTVTIDSATLTFTPSIPSGGEVSLSKTITDASASPGRKILKVTATFEDNSKVTHIYEVIARKSPS